MTMLPFLLRRRLSLMLRLGIICTLVTLATMYYATPEPALVAYLAFFINRDDRVSSDRLSVAIVLLATLMIALVFFLARHLADYPQGRVATMALLSLLLLFLTSASKLRAIGGILTLVLAFALDLMGNSPLSELLTRGLLYAWLFVAIPAAVSLLVNRLLAATPSRLLQLALAQRLNDGRSVLRGEISPKRLQLALFGYDTDLAMLLTAMQKQKDLSDDELATMCSMVGASDALLLAIAGWVQQRPGIVPQARQLADTLGVMAADLHSAKYPLRQQCDCPAPEFTTEFQRSAWNSLIFIIEHFSSYPVPAPAVHASDRLGFFAADAWSNPEHWRYALKTTLAAMLCYLVYSLLSWPGIHTCMLTCYLVSLATVAESVEKLLLRISGCLIGATLGLTALVFVVPQIDTPQAYLLLVFSGALLAAWFASSSQRISYLGVQMAFAFFICVIQGNGPSYNMVDARDRIIGILLGNAVLYLITTRLWPVSIGQRIQTRIQQLNATLQELASCRNYAAFLPGLNLALTRLSQLQTDLWRTRYETLQNTADPATARDDNDTVQSFVTGLTALTVAVTLRERTARLSGNSRNPQARVVPAPSIVLQSGQPS